MSAEIKSYDRLPRIRDKEQETVRAFEAFCIFRDLGVARTIARTEQVMYAGVKPEYSRRSSGNRRVLERWSSQYRWIERVGDYDRDQQAILRQHTTAKNIEEHDQELEQFRQNNKRMGAALFDLGEKLATIGNRIIEDIGNKQTLTAYDIDTFLKLPASVKAIANFATIGGDLTADGLLIRQMLEKMKEDGES